MPRRMDLTLESFRQKFEMKNAKELTATSLSGFFLLHNLIDIQDASRQYSYSVLTLSVVLDRWTYP